MERVELPAGMPGPPAVIFVPAGRKDVVLENFENPPANDDPESPYSEEPYPDADTAADVEASLGYMEKAVEDLPESVERGLGYIADDVEQGAENIADWVTGKDQDKEDEVDDQYNQ
jgi:hypothetical protein